MNAHGQPNDSWEPCSPGQFAASAEQHRFLLKRRQFLKVSAAGLGLMGVTGLTWLVTHEWFNGTLAQINCVQAIAYLKNWNTLSTQEHNAAIAHCRHCPACRAEYTKQGIIT